jgi:HEAT repeat protein
MLQRSTWSGLLLSAAVFATCSLTGASAFAQDAAPATAPATDAAAATSAPAPTGPLKSLADDYLHYSLVNNLDLAQANGQAILNANPAPKDLLAAFEDAANGRNPREIMIRNQERPELRDVSSQLLDRLEEGYRSVARDPARIRADIERLDNGPRAYNNARDHLVAAGQFAAPLFIEYLQNNDKASLRPYILRVMVEIGRPLMLPLLEALQVNDPGIRIALVKVIGEIGYPQALPALRSIQVDAATSGELKNAVDQAIASIDKTGGAANTAPAALFLKSANNYYDKKPSYQPLLLSEKTNPVWVFDKGLNNVAPLQVPTVIWTDVMALHNAEETLALDGNNSEAISLWLSADLRREIALPAGAADPTHDNTKPEAAFYARAFGPIYVNPVLSRALDAHDAALALRAIDALEATGGISGLVSASNGAPLIRALTYPDRDVRFHAAFALARANPTSSYPSAFRVVPTLAEALGSKEQPVALIVSSDEDVRNKLADGLRGGATPYTIYSASTLAKALDEAKTASTISAVIVASGPEADGVQLSAHTDHRLDSASVVVLAPTDQVKPWSGDRASYKTVDEHSDAAAVTTAIGQVSTALGTGGGSAAANADYVKTSLELLHMIAADHKSIYSINDAVPALSNAIKDSDAAVVTSAANVLGELNNADAQRTLASAALASDVNAALRAPLLTAVAESAKHTGNALDASAVNSLIKVVQTEKDPAVRLAAATALGALNVPSNQASTLILQQSTVQ